MMPENPPQEEIIQNNFIRQFLGNKKNVYFLGAILLFVISIPFIFFLISGLKSENKGVSNISRPIIYPNAPYLSGELIVKYKSSYSYDEILNLKGKLEKIGVVSQKQLFDSKDPGLSNFYILTFKEDTDLKKVAEELSKTPEIEAVGANYIFKNQVTPNDP